MILSILTPTVIILWAYFIHLFTLERHVIPLLYNNNIYNNFQIVPVWNLPSILILRQVFIVKYLIVLILLHDVFLLSLKAIQTCILHMLWCFHFNNIYFPFFVPVQNEVKRIDFTEAFHSFAVSQFTPFSFRLLSIGLLRFYNPMLLSSFLPGSYLKVLFLIPYYTVTHLLKRNVFVADLAWLSCLVYSRCL